MAVAFKPTSRLTERAGTNICYFFLSGQLDGFSGWSAQARSSGVSVDDMRAMNWIDKM